MQIQYYDARPAIYEHLFMTQNADAVSGTWVRDSQGKRSSLHRTFDGASSGSSPKTEPELDPDRIRRQLQRHRRLDRLRSEPAVGRLHRCPPEERQKHPLVSAESSAAGAERAFGFRTRACTPAPRPTRRPARAPCRSTSRRASCSTRPSTRPSCSRCAPTATSTRGSATRRWRRSKSEWRVSKAAWGGG